MAFLYNLNEVDVHWKITIFYKNILKILIGCYFSYLPI